MARVHALMCLSNFNRAREEWVGLIPPPMDTVGNATFEAYMNQMDAGMADTGKKAVG